MEFINAMLKLSLHASVNMVRTEILQKLHEADITASPCSTVFPGMFMMQAVPWCVSVVEFVFSIQKLPPKIATELRGESALTLSLPTAGRSNARIKKLKNIHCQTKFPSMSSADRALSTTHRTSAHLIDVHIFKVQPCVVIILGKVE